MRAQLHATASAAMSARKDGGGAVRLLSPRREKLRCDAPLHTSACPQTRLRDGEVAPDDEEELCRGRSGVCAELLTLPHRGQLLGVPLVTAPHRRGACSAAEKCR